MSDLINSDAEQKYRLVFTQMAEVRLQLVMFT